MRYSTENADIPEDCHCAEIAALNALVDDFAAAIKAKLQEQTEDGRSGWDAPSWEPGQIRRALLEHVGLSDQELDDVAAGDFDAVDVAAFAAFYWNRQGETRE